jgi:GAF domain-containing protein
VLLDIVPVSLRGEAYVLTTVRDLTAQRRAEQAALLYEASKERLRDLAAIEQVHQVSSLFLRDADPRDLLDAVLDAAIAITEADFGNIQILDARTSDLQITVHRGLPASWIEFWNRMSKGHGACGTALEHGSRVIVEDVTQSEIFIGTDALRVQLEAGVRAVQSTPLVSRTGTPVGIISTHYRTSQRPSDRALRFLDVLAREAADILERTRFETALRRSEAKAKRILAGVADAIVSVNARGRIVEWNDAAERMFGYSSAEALGMELDVLIPKQSQAKHRENVASFAIEPGGTRLMAHKTAAGGTCQRG